MRRSTDVGLQWVAVARDKTWPGTASDQVFLERTTKRDGLTLAAPTQIAADLLTGSGRMPSEGEELIAWMKDNERVWRT